MEVTKGGRWGNRRCITLIADGDEEEATIVHMEHAAATGTLTVEAVDGDNMSVRTTLGKGRPFTEAEDSAIRAEANPGLRQIARELLARFRQNKR